MLDGGWAATQYETLIEGAAPTSERHETTISISVDIGASRRAVRAAGGGITGAAAVLRQEMNSVAAALQAAELTIDGWVEPDELAVMLRLAYDPGAVHALDRTSRVGRKPGCDFLFLLARIPNSRPFVSRMFRCRSAMRKDRWQPAGAECRPRHRFQYDSLLRTRPVRPFDQFRRIRRHRMIA